LVENELSYKMTKLLEILDDGNWHDTNQLSQQMKLSESEVQKITDFLGKYDFAEADESKKRVRINKGFKRILAQTR
jgi:DNA-binding IclR family transcriptional regulator